VRTHSAPFHYFDHTFKQQQFVHALPAFRVKPLQIQRYFRIMATEADADGRPYYCHCGDPDIERLLLLGGQRGSSVKCVLSTDPGLALRLSQPAAPSPGTIASMLVFHVDESAFRTRRVDGFPTRDDLTRFPSRAQRCEPGA
jgi:hypothetical protein